MFDGGLSDGLGGIRAKACGSVWTDFTEQRTAGFPVDSGCTRCLKSWVVLPPPPGSAIFNWLGNDPLKGGRRLTCLTVVSPLEALGRAPPEVSRRWSAGGCDPAQAQRPGLLRAGLGRPRALKDCFSSEQFTIQVIFLFPF